MKLLKYTLTIFMALLLLSPYVAAEDFVHTLGGKVVPSLDEQELTQFIRQETELWSESTVSEISASHPNLLIQPDDFQFAIESSVTQFLEKADVPWYAFWKRKQEVHQPLTVTISERLTEELDEDPSIDTVQTTNELQLKASILSSEPIQLIGSNISTLDMERFSFVNVQTGLPAAELQAVTELINEKVVQPHEVLSLLSTLEQAAAPISEQTANFVASMLYVAVLQSEFEIIERHSQGVVPSYTTLGLEAMISQKLARDFQFKNTFDTPVTIQASHIGGVFLIEFYTLSPDSTATYEVGSREEIEPKRVERLVADLQYGAERKVEDGQSGWRVTTYRTITSSSGSFETQEVVARDYYPPRHDVYEVSSQPPPPEITTPTDGQSSGDGTTTGGSNPDGSSTPGTTNGDGSSSDPEGNDSGTGGTDGDSSNGDGTSGSTDNTGGTSDGTGNGYDKGGNKVN